MGLALGVVGHEGESWCLERGRQGWRIADVGLDLG